MGEVITLHIGQAGINMGTAFWEELIRETSKDLVEEDQASAKQLSEEELQGYKLLPNNKKKNPFKHCTKIVQPKKVKGTVDHERPHAFFREKLDGSLVPRAVFVDRGPDPIEQVMGSRLGGCMSQSHSFVYDLSQPRGVCLDTYYENLFLDDIFGAVRKHAEATDSLAGILLTFGIAGGTASGAIMRTSDRFSDEFKNKTKACFAVYPSIGSQQLSTEAYNSALVHKSLTDMDLVTMLDNKAIHDHLCYHRGVDLPTMSDVNRVIAQLISNITAGTRFSSASDHSLQTLAANLIMYSGMPFVTPSLLDASLVSPGLPPCPAELASQILQPYSCLVGTKPASGKLLATYMSMRGAVSQSQAVMAAQLMRAEYQFVAHSPTPVKLEVVRRLPAYAGADGLMLSALTSTTAVSSYFQKIMDSHDVMWEKRGFYHLYNSWKGSEMSEEIDVLRQRIIDYQELGSETVEDVAEDNQDL